MLEEFGNLLGKSVYPITVTLYKKDSLTMIYYIIYITPLSVTYFSPGTVYSQFPPFSDARSTITEPYFIKSTISVSISFGAGLPGIKAVVMIISTSYFFNDFI